MYYAVSNKNLAYVAPPPSGASPPRLRSAKVAVATNWVLNTYKYPNTMNVVAKLYAPDKAEVTVKYVLGAFVGNECRGIGKVVDGRIFLTVYGNEPGEVISFRAYDPESENLMSVAETALFGDALLGSLDKPFESRITGLLTSLSEGGLYVDVYPNPVQSSLYLDLNRMKVNEIRITAMDGKLLYLAGTYVREKGIDVSGLMDGTYLITLKTDGGTLHRKFIKMGGTNQ
jgi:hypothetical protein